MDAPPIQYARTDDGVNIAYWTLGEGPTLLHLVQHGMSHVQLEWQVPAIREWYEKLAGRFQVVRLDFRSCGLSDVAQESLGIDAYVKDIEAVVRSINVERLAIYAGSFAGAVAIRYAAAHPDEVARLALFSPWLRMPEPERNALKAVPLMMGADMDYLARSLANARSGQNDAEGHWARVFRNAVSLERQPRLAEAYMAMDVRDDAATIESPTLIMSTDFLQASVSAREVAANIPSAKLTAFDESAVADPFFMDQERMLDAIVPFLSEGFASEGTEEAVGAVDTDASLGRPSDSEPSAPVDAGLTNREIEVVRLVSRGLSNEAIGKELVISSATVARHVSNVLNKTGLSNRTELAHFAGESGLV